MSIIRDVNLPLFGGIPLFFFYFPLFLKIIFRFFWKIAKIVFFISLPTPPLSTVRRASVKSRWRLGLPVCAFPFPVEVHGRSSKRRIYTPAAMLRVGVQPWPPRRRGGEGGGLVAGWRMGLKWSQEFRPSNSSICTSSLSTFITSHTHAHTHTHTHSLSLSFSLSLSYTHALSGLPTATISP